MLNYKVSRLDSEAEWVVFLHGAGGNINAWSRQWPTFKAYFNLLAIDLRDHGLSKDIKPKSSNYTFELISADILKVIDHLGITKANFITLSFGSVLIQDLALRRPTLISKVIMAGGIFKANNSIKAFVHLARFFNLFLPYRIMYSVFSFLLMPGQKHQISRRLYQRHADQLTSREYLRWVGLYREFFRLLERFYNSAIPGEVEVIMGSDDYVFLPAAKKFEARHRNVTMRIIPNAGHICNIDQAELFNRSSLDFFRKQS